MIDVIITGPSPGGDGRRPVMGFCRKNVKTGSTERSMLRCRFTAACRKNGKPGLPRVRNIETVLQRQFLRSRMRGSPSFRSSGEIRSMWSIRTVQISRKSLQNFSSKSFPASPANRTVRWSSWAVRAISS